MGDVGQMRLKRVLDIVVGSIALVLAAPLMLFVAASVAVLMGPPVLFRQVRPGLHGKPFVIYKFRTMAMPSGATVRVDDAERLTTLGRFLRRTSLDELPELWNVLKGNMSLVGPRPLLMEYLSQYTPQQARRHEMKPGITGWAQVNGRNAVAWEKRFELDVWYIDNWSLWLDLKILWRTLALVLRGNGISARGHATMPPYRARNQQDLPM